MHPALLKASGWRYSGRMRDLVAAKWCNCFGEFDKLPRYKQVEVVALYEIGWRMDAVNAWEAARGAK